MVASDRLRRRVPDRHRRRSRWPAPASRCGRRRPRPSSRGWRSSTGASWRPGMTAARRRRLAVELFCAIEGAFLLSRTTRSTEAIEVAGRAATEHVRRRAARADPYALSMAPASAVLLLSCPDRPGLVAAVSDFVFRHGGNILRRRTARRRIRRRRAAGLLPAGGVQLESFDLPREGIGPPSRPLPASFDMSWQVRFPDETVRMALLVSKQPHCLDDLLGRWHTGDLGAVDIPVVVSNHPDHVERVEFMGARYVHLPVTPDTRSDQERALVEAPRAARHRSDRPRPLHADPLAVVRATATRAGSSTSTTRSCPRSSARGPTTRRTPGA